MSIQAGLWDEEIELVRPKIPLVWAAFAAFSPLLFLPISLALGWSEVGVGPSPSATSALVKTGLYAIALHGILVWPLCGYVFFQPTQRWGLFEKALATLVLFSSPIISFLYFRSGEGLTDVWDLALTVVPSVFLGTLVCARGERVWLFSLSLALATAIPWLWLGDRLGGFSPVFTYGMLSSDGQVLRTALAALSIAGGALAYALGIPLEGSALRTAGKCLGALGILHLAVGVVLPLGALAMGGGSPPISPHWTLILYPWMILVCIRPEALGRRAYTAAVVFALGAMGELFEVAVGSQGLQADLWSLARWSACLMSAGAVVFLMIRVISKYQKS